jgi:hypothetical protein
VITLADVRVDGDILITTGGGADSITLTGGSLGAATTTVNPRHGADQVLLGGFIINLLKIGLEGSNTNLPGADLQISSDFTLSAAVGIEVIGLAQPTIGGDSLDFPAGTQSTAGVLTSLLPHGSLHLADKLALSTGSLSIHRPLDGFTVDITAASLANPSALAATVIARGETTIDHVATPALRFSGDAAGEHISFELSDRGAVSPISGMVETLFDSGRSLSIGGMEQGSNGVME